MNIELPEYAGDDNRETPRPPEPRSLLDEPIGFCRRHPDKGPMHTVGYFDCIGNNSMRDR